MATIVVNDKRLANRKWYIHIQETKRYINMCVCTRMIVDNQNKRNWMFISYLQYQNPLKQEKIFSMISLKELSIWHSAISSEIASVSFH